MHTHSRVFKTTAQLLIAVMFGQSLLAAAAGLSVDSSAGANTQITQAGNGVPLINIATPNGNGLSYNKFTDYNVGQQGLILNNSTDKFTQTQLGGVIIGNNNLNGKSAQLILNEVTGGQASQLKGYSEVAGKQAHVVVANPHGITCDGCGFINTPHATLTTGKPIIEQGQLKRYDVEGGQIEISGEGLNATNVSQFDLITRSAKINAELHANQLNIITGRNSVDAQTLTATAKADRPDDKPSLAIDSSALGGMYAGAIRLVGTEAGVGVKLAGDMAASAGDIRIDANGRLSLARTAARGDIKLNAAQIDLTQDVYSEQSAQIIAQNGAITVNDSLAAAGDLDLNAALIDNHGVIESGSKTAGSSNTASILTVQGGEFKNQGKVVAQGVLNTDLNVLNNQGGQIVAVGAALIDANHLDNRGGQLVGQHTLDLKVQQLDNAQGTLASNHGLTIQASDQINNNSDGLILSQSGDLSISSQTINNQRGVLQANTGVVNLTANRSLNNQSVKILANSNSLQLNAQHLNNQKGVIQAHSIAVTGGGILDNRQGQMIATQGNLQLAQAAINNDGGKLISQQNLTVDASSLSNQSGLIGGQEVAVNLTGHLNNNLGLVEATNSLLLSAGSASNGSGRLRALGQAGSSAFTIKTLFNNDKGVVEVGNQSFLLNSQALSNQQGTIRHLGDQFALSLSDAGQAGGSFLTNGILKLDVDRWLNSSELQAQQIELKVNHFTNTATGVLRSIDDLHASGNTWVNNGQIETEGALHLSLTDSYTGKGALHSQGNLYLKSQNIDLQQGASVRSAQNALFELGGRLLNAGALSAAGDVQIRASDIDNQATLGAGQKLRIETNHLLNQGLVFSGADMALRSNTLTNQYGDIYSLGALTAAKDDAYTAMALLENRSGSIESDADMELYASTLTNRKDQFRLGKTLTSGHISVKCYDCSGDKHNVDYIATERFEFTVEEDSAAARIHSGGNLTVQGDAIANHYSNISASGHISIIADILENLAASTGTAQRVQSFNTGRVTDGTDERFRWNYIYPYNAQALPKSLPSALYRWRLISDIETQTPTDSAAPAIIQAGGSVNIQARESINNASLLENQAPIAGSAQTLNTHLGSSSQPLVLQLSAQLPADLNQQLVDPTALPGFSLPQSSSGLFAVNSNVNHPYLIETNPLFASMSGFLNSNYLLQGLGYDPAQAQKRLGDGLYEQRLIEQAVIARTGKRFLDGLTSNDDQFRYLMDNGIASKESLKLSLGISLTGEQVAALTHDIVWLEEREVQGEKVLVPILYLAQATDRVAPTGALIQGRDVALISGAELNNSGMLRGSSNLSVNAENISNSGLIQADERLQLLAQDSIHNQRGGLIKGRDVSLLAVTGDISNERTITQEARSGKGFSQTTSIVDQAAGIEAAHDLSLMAGRDIINQGANLKAGAAMELNAGRNVLLVSAEENNGQMRQDKRHFWSNSSATQHASDIQAGTQLNISAGQDVAVVASRLKAGGDMSLQAGDDVLITSAANTQSSEYRYRRSGKKVNQENTKVRQQASVLEAGGQLISVSGADTQLVSSHISAGKEAYLVAGGKVQLLAEQDYDYSFYEKKKKGRFGRKSYRMNESSASSAVVSSVSAANDLAIQSGSSLLSKGSRLHAGEQLTLQAAKDIQLLAAQDSQSKAQAKSKKGLLSSKAKTSSQSQTRAVGSELTGREISVIAGRDVLVAGGNMRSEADTFLQAGRDIDVTTVQQHSSQSSSKQSSRLSLSHYGLLTHSQKKQSAQQGNAESVGSYISADNLIINSGRDAQIQGSTLIAEQDMSITAGRDLRVGSAENTGHYASSSSSKKIGGIGSWWQPAVGQVKLKKQAQGETIQQSSSQLASLTGNIMLKAGENYQQTASQVVAIEGDVDIQAQQVTIEADYDQFKHREKQSASRTAIGGAVSVPVLDSVQSMQQVGRAMSRTEDSRMQALGAATLAMQSKTAYEGAKALVNKDPTGVKFSVSLGSQKSKSQSAQQSRSVVASSVVAGGDVHIQASGSSASDIQIIGSTVSAGRDIDLLASRNILLAAAKNTSEHNSKNSGSGWSAGVGLSIGGSQTGFTLDLAANQFQGKSNGNDSLWSNAQLEAGRQVNLESGQATVLKGAVIKGEHVTAQVGGDLILESLQDTSTYKSKSSSSSVGAGLCIPPFCAGASTASGSYNNSKVKGDYASVSEQTGIQAGDGGFQLKVQGHTDLTGSVIASSELAVENNLNRLETGTLAARDIENYSKYKASAASVSGGYNFGIGAVNKEIVSKMTEDKKNIAALSGSGASQLKGSERSTTRSGISGGTIVITDLEAQRKRTGQAADDLLAILERDTRTGEGSGGLSKNWDGAKLAQQVQANAQIMTAFSQQAGLNISAYVEQKRKELREQINNTNDPEQKRQLEQEMGTLNTQERLMNVFVGTLTGTVDTAVAHAVLQEAAEHMREYTIADSKKFAGVTDGETVIDSKSGESAGIRGDLFKTAGTRVVLDVVCGKMNERCKVQQDEDGKTLLDNKGLPKLMLTEQGMVEFVPDKVKGNLSLAEFLTQDPDGKKMSGLTGGIQGAQGTLNDWPYTPDGILDFMHESFGGSHDFISGTLSGYYDEQGNARRGLSKTQENLYEVWAAVALLPSAPFAMSEALPSEAWAVLDILLKTQ